MAFTKRKDADKHPLGSYRIARKVATERDLLNSHGTFYELPARNAGGIAKLRAVATHNRLVHDFCSYRGLYIMSAIDTAETKNKHIIKSDDGKTAVWAGTIAESLKKNGYKTGYIGKFHHGTTDKVTGRGFPMNHGFDTFFGFAGGTKHYLVHDAKYKGHPMGKGPLWNQKEHVNIEGFTTEIFGKKAREFIQTHKDERFYLHLSFNGVHNYTHQLPDAYLKEKGLKSSQNPTLKRKIYGSGERKSASPLALKDVIIISVNFIS